MLPYELLTLILLASVSAAYPQQPAVVNITQISDPPLITITREPTGGIFSGPIGGQICDSGSRTCIFIIPGLTSVSGFEDPNDFNKPSKPAVLHPPSKPPAVTVETTPTVVLIQTNFAPTVPPGQTLGPGPGATPYSPNPQDPSNNDLLHDILSRVTNPQQPTGSEHQEPIPQVTSPTIIDGQPITVGPTSLTLTPGLSTTVGTGTDATFIGMTTDGAGQTIITISSSGTAVTATITNAPRTVTLAKSGFEASLTDAARPGDIVRTNSGNAAAATSSKGGAPPHHRRDGMEWWAGLVLGVVGMGVVV